MAVASGSGIGGLVGDGVGAGVLVGVGVKVTVGVGVAMAGGVGVLVSSGVGGWVGANVGVLVDAGVAVAVRTAGEAVGTWVPLGSESSQATTAAIRRTNSPPTSSRVNRPIRCLSASLIPMAHR